MRREFASKLSGAGRIATSIVGMDLRALALLRIAIGILILCDLIQRLPLIDLFYTDRGVLPRSEWSGNFQGRRPLRLSLHALAGGSEVETALFIVAAALAVALVLGYRTRLATLGSWILLVSLHNRNPLVLIGGDDELRVLLFFALFLPWGEGSPSSNGVRDAPSGSEVARTVGTLGFGVQIALVYLFAVLLKTGPEWHEERTAIHYVLSFDDTSAPLGRFILRFPELLASMTPVVLAIELAAVLIPFVPPALGKVRTLLVLSIMSLHAAFAASMNIGLFPFVSMAAWLAFLPPWFFDGPLARTRRFVLSLAPDVERRRGAESPSPEPVRESGPKIEQTGKKLARRIRTGVGRAICGFAVVYIVALNAESLGQDLRLVPPALRWFGDIARLDQKWNLYAPSPRKDNGWYVFPGRLSSGREIDVYSEAPIRWDRPMRNRPEQMKETVLTRWYMRRMRLKNNKGQLRQFARYLCTRWNASHSESLEELAIFFVLEKTPPPGGESEAPKSNRLLLHRCGEPSNRRAREVESSMGDSSE